MRIILEKRDVIPLILLLMFLGLNLGGFILFPYETLNAVVVDNYTNYTIVQMLTMLSIIPICLFFISLGYLAGVGKCNEKSV